MLQAVILALAGPAFAQSADGLRPSLDDEADAVEQAPPARPKVTQLEAGAAEDEAAPRRKRRDDSDPYAPQGLDAGAFRLFPVLEAGVSLSSNPALNETKERADAGIYLRPEIRLQSDWLRHQLDASVKGDFIYFASDPSADFQSIDATSKLRLDVLRTTTLEFDGAYTAESSADPGDQGPSGFDHTASEFATLTHRMGDLAISAKTGIRLNTFGETEGTGNSDLNYIEPEVSLRAAYELGPSLTPIVEAGYRPRVFLKTRDRNGIERSSQGAFAGAGLNFNLPPFWSAEAAVNYLVRDYDDPSLSSTGSFSARGNVAWKPTDFTTVTLSGSSALSDSSADSVDGSRTYTADLDLAHDLRENITLNAGAGIVAEEGAAAGADLTFTAGADVAYRLTPWLALTAAYDYLAFDSASASGDYQEHRVSAGVEIRR